MTEPELQEYYRKAIQLHLDLKLELYTNKLKEFQDLKEWLEINQNLLPACVLFTIGNGILKCPCPDITI